MDYSKFKTPYISNAEIKNRADLARGGLCDGKVPIDIENILMTLKVNVIPLPNLRSQINFDSFITSNWENVYVDNDDYLDDFQYRRVRFSLAHELGHLILHRKLFESLNIRTLEEYYNFYEQVPGDQYGYLEAQANSFAGYFLVPREELFKYREEILKKFRKKLEDSGVKIKDEDLMEYLINPLDEIFNVSGQAIRIALQNK